MAKPFLKWAGGKRQMLPEIQERLPTDIDQYNTYIEPFVGAGAVLFHLLEKYDFESVHIADINPELILCYRTLQSSAPVVITHLQSLIDSYPKETEDRKEVYYAIRQEWNDSVNDLDGMSEDELCLRAAQTIFLNKTCYNGLFRVNNKGEFNTPFGRYDKPSFPPSEELLQVQEALQGVSIHLADFEECIEWTNERTFVYFDPPYRPLSKTSHFISYSKRDFNDDDQRRLSEIFRILHERGNHLLLSNSDPTNTVPEDDFFDILYTGFGIDRVTANRSINVVARGRGPIRELLVHNYPITPMKKYTRKERKYTLEEPYTCKDETIIWTEPGEKSALDFKVKYKKINGRPRTPKHIHFVNQLIVYREHNLDLTLSLVEELLQIAKNVEQSDTNFPDFQFEVDYHQFEELDKYGEDSAEFILRAYELVIIQEKNNYPNGNISVELLEGFQNGRDQFWLTNKATIRGVC